MPSCGGGERRLAPRPPQSFAGEDRQRPVLLRADARTPHQAVVTAYDALAQSGFRTIQIATAPEVKR